MTVANTPVRATTAGEKTNYRASGGWTDVAMYIQQPSTVYQMRINQTFSTLDGVAQFAYDGGVGTLSDIEVGMTVLISAVGFGYAEKGVCRVRRVPASGIAYINPVSHIQFADNDYVTFINSFSLWGKDPTFANGELFMDYDIPFGDFNLGGCIPRVGPIAAVTSRTAGTVDFSPVSPALSACYDGQTISSYLCACPTAASVTNPTTTDPTITFTSAGEHRFTWTITDSAGRQTKTHRWVIVDPTPTEFQFKNFATDFDSGGASFSVRVYDNLTAIYDRAMVVFYTTRESNGGVSTKIGKIAGYENVLMVGWIEGKSIDINAVEGYAEFTVYGPAHWLSRARSLPFLATYVSGTPSTWTEITNLTADKAIAHLLYWQTTAPLVMDCFLSGNTVVKDEYSTPAENIFDQLREIGAWINAMPMVNTYGQLYIQTDPQFLSSADRALLTTVMDLTKDDIEGAIRFKVDDDKCSRFELGGYASYDGVLVQQIYSRAPGNFGSELGEYKYEDNYIFADQAECNRICGVMYALQNSPYGAIDIDLAFQPKLFDIAPAQKITLTTSSTDNPLGVAFTSSAAVVRAINWNYKSGSLRGTLTVEMLVTGVDGVTYVPPIPEDINVDDDLYGIDDGGDFDGVDFPDAGLGDWFPETNPPTGLLSSTPCDGNETNTFNSTWDTRELGNGSQISRCYFPCWVFNNAEMDMQVKLGGDADASVISVYGIKSGARVITGTVTATIYTSLYQGWRTALLNVQFSTVTPVQVDGFEIELTAGDGAVVTYRQDGYAFASGTVQANNGTGIAVNLTVGNYYVITNDGTGWQSGAGTAYGVKFIDLSGVYTEVISPTIYKTYSLATIGTAHVTVADTIFGDNSGQSGYFVANAERIARRLRLSTVQISNVCDGSLS